MGSITLENTNSWPDSAKPLSVRGGKPPTQVYRLRLFSSGAAELFWVTCYRVPHLSRIGLSCSSSGLALPRIRFRASAYSASLWASDFTG